MLKIEEELDSSRAVPVLGWERWSRQDGSTKIQMAALPSFLFRELYHIYLHRL